GRKLTLAIGRKFAPPNLRYAPDSLFCRLSRTLMKSRDDVSDDGKDARHAGAICCDPCNAGHCAVWPIEHELIRVFQANEGPESEARKRNFPHVIPLPRRAVTHGIIRSFTGFIIAGWWTAVHFRICHRCPG